MKMQRVEQGSFNESHEMTLCRKLISVLLGKKKKKNVNENVSRLYKMYDFKMIVCKFSAGQECNVYFENSSKLFFFFSLISRNKNMKMGVQE